MNRLLIILCFASMLFSCTETPIMVAESEVPLTKRVVLLEDLTGVQCPNCPKGAAAIKSMKAKFGDNLAAIGIHGTFLTKPLPESKFDFRNPKAIALEDFLKPFLGKPSAQINRRKFESQDYACVDAVELWESFVLEELRKELEMDIELVSKYDEATRNLTIEMKATSLITESGPFKTSVYITESKIEDPQENQGTIIEDYEHEHVLRDMLTAASGDEFATTLDKNQVVNKSYTYTIPATFKPENMEVIVMVSRTKPDDKSVLQAKGIKVK
jgi:hypothetical protein